MDFYRNRALNIAKREQRFSDCLILSLFAHPCSQLDHVILTPLSTPSVPALLLLPH